MHSIKSKILLIYSFLIFLIFVVASVAIYNLYGLNKAVDGLIEANYRSIVAAENMIYAIERQDSNELIYLQVQSEDSLKDFYENQKEFITWMTKAKVNITEDSEIEVLDRLSKSYSIYNQSFLKLQQSIVDNDIHSGRSIYSKDIYPIFIQIKSDCEKLLEINEKAMFNSKEKATEKSRNQMYGTALFSILVIVLGLFVAIFNSRRIVKPLYVLIDGIKSIKEGNLNQVIKVSSKDEIGKLADEFNSMAKRLQIYEKSNIKSIISERNKSIAIVKSISDPIIVTDNNYKILLINNSAERLFKIREKEMLGRHVLEYINNPFVFECLKKLVEKEDYEDESNVVTINKDGKTNHYIVTVTNILGEEDTIIGNVTVLQNITTLKEIEEAKTNFISTVSHELRTPLTSIVMGNGILLDKTIGPLNSDQEEVVQAMDEDGKALLALVNDLLDLSKIEAGKLELSIKEASIYDVIINSLKTFGEIAKEKGVILNNTIDKDTPILRIDISKITSVINNLIANAIKFSKSADIVTISAKVKDNEIEVSVSDTGIGISKEDQLSIFEKFVQVKGLSNDNKGTGLGLAIAKEYVGMHGGSIWVESVLGQGSKFVFTLPLL